jgi:hypothetical protein
VRGAKSLMRHRIRTGCVILLYGLLLGGAVPQQEKLIQANQAGMTIL